MSSISSDIGYNSDITVFTIKLTTILKNGGQVQVEGFIDGHWGILASQDCDIRPNKYLIIFSLEYTKTPYESQNIIKAIDQNIKDTTRRLYLPRISPPNEIYAILIITKEV